MKNLIKVKNFWCGVKAIKKPYQGKYKPKWSIKFKGFGKRSFWINLWTPVWHEGRGPYISIGFYLFAIYRGY